MGVFFLLSGILLVPLLMAAFAFFFGYTLADKSTYLILVAAWLAICYGMKKIVDHLDV